MYMTTSLLATLLIHPLAVISQATTTAPDLSQQTLVPFATLPACATKCGILYDVQGGCVPPRVEASGSTTCFCGDVRLQPFYTTTTGVCDGACTNNPDGLNQIRQWFIGFCSKSNTATTTTGGTQPTGGATGTAAPGSSTNAPAASSGNQNSTWVSTHWQWIVMIVVLALGITIGWIAACFFRRRYIRKKEREFELRPPAAPWVAGQPPAGLPGVSPHHGGALSKGKDKEATAGMFVPQPTNAARMSEKPEQKKWVVKERT